MSITKRVLLLLKMEVRELIRAAIITAIIKPRSPGQKKGKEKSGLDLWPLNIILSSLQNNLLNLRMDKGGVITRAEGAQAHLHKGKGFSPSGMSSITSLG